MSIKVDSAPIFKDGSEPLEKKIRRLIKILIISSFLLTQLTGCKSRDAGSAAKAYDAPVTNEVRLSWYTNRETNYGSPASESEFSARISQLLPAKGVIATRIPQGYVYGDSYIQRPSLEIDDNAFNAELINGAVEPQFNKTATVFVHGYNTTAEEAFERAIQLYTALDHAPPSQRSFKTQNFAFSWPSLGLTVDDFNIVKWLQTGQPFYARTYRQDETTAAQSVRPFTEFLNTLCKERYGLKYDHINVIGHSMGARLVSEAVADMSRAFQRQIGTTDLNRLQAAMPCRIDNLVLASGDIGLLRFRELLPDLLLITNKITLYVNATLIAQAIRIGVTADLPLALSKLLHFLHGFELGPRIGQQNFLTNLLDQRVDVVVMKYLHDVDSGAGHNHVFESQTVLKDLTHVLNHETSPQRAQYNNLVRNYYMLK